MKFCRLVVLHSTLRIFFFFYFSQFGRNQIRKHYTIERKEIFFKHFGMEFFFILHLFLLCCLCVDFYPNKMKHGRWQKMRFLIPISSWQLCLIDINFFFFRFSTHEDWFAFDFFFLCCFSSFWMLLCVFSFVLILLKVFFFLFSSFLSIAAN